MITGTKSRWRPVPRGAPQGSILDPVLLSICVNDLDDGIEHTLSKSAGSTKPGEADIPDGCAVKGISTGRIYLMTYRNPIKFKKKEMVLYEDWNNLRH